MASLLSRVSNRYFLDVDICELFLITVPGNKVTKPLTGRNKDFVDVSVNYAIRAFKAAEVINTFPTILHP
jgi:carbonic anhydrase